MIRAAFLFLITLGAVARAASVPPLQLGVVSSTLLDDPRTALRSEPSEFVLDRLTVDSATIVHDWDYYFLVVAYDASGAAQALPDGVRCTPEPHHVRGSMLAMGGHIGIGCSIDADAMPEAGELPVELSIELSFRNSTAAADTVVVSRPLILLPPYAEDSVSRRVQIPHSSFPVLPRGVVEGPYEPFIAGHTPQITLPTINTDPLDDLTESLEVEMRARFTRWRGDIRFTEPWHQNGVRPLHTQMVLNSVAYDVLPAISLSELSRRSLALGLVDPSFPTDAADEAPALPLRGWFVTEARVEDGPWELISAPELIEMLPKPKHIDDDDDDGGHDKGGLTKEDIEIIVVTVVAVSLAVAGVVTAVLMCFRRPPPTAGDLVNYESSDEEQPRPAVSAAINERRHLLDEPESLSSEEMPPARGNAGMADFLFGLSPAPTAVPAIEDAQIIVETDTAVQPAQGERSVAPEPESEPQAHARDVLGDEDLYEDAGAALASAAEEGSE